MVLSVLQLQSMLGAATVVRDTDAAVLAAVRPHLVEPAAGALFGGMIVEDVNSGFTLSSRFPHISVYCSVSLLFAAHCLT